MEQLQNQTVRLATWNIRKCVGLDRRRDPHRVARTIAELEADVVVLQEADKRLGSRPAALTRDIVETETDMLPADAGGHEASIGFHGNAVLLAPGLGVKTRHSVHLPGVEPRGALILDIEGKISMRVVAVHLGLMRSSRRAQLATIRERLTALPDRPTVVLGDFNEWSERRGLEPLTGFDVHAPGRSFHAARPIAALDRIAINDTFELRDAAVVENARTRVASDHLPVWADLQTTTSISS
ncbi:MAG: metal-dependent hydrolase [Silicimonas sp.]|nr:metal-dependent hydrolase [Silicimonas sp.]